MREFSSIFVAEIKDYLKYREAFGFTTRSYEVLLGAFDRFCCEIKPQTNCLTRQLVLDWLAKESEKSGTHYKADAIRQFGKFLADSGKTAYVLPANFVKETSTFTPYIMTNAELTAFFNAVDSIKPNRYDNRKQIIFPVLFRLLYTCGLRPNEGRELKTTGINFTTGEIFIRHNKQKKERIVVMSKNMLEMCCEYAESRKTFANGSEYFFPSPNGKPYTPVRLYNIFKKCWKSANPDISDVELPSARPYDLRHRFASEVMHRLLGEGKDLYAALPYLRTYMGHENFSSTAYYIHLMPENLVKSSGIDMSAFENIIPEV